jgi:hypothetical protein
MERFHHQFVLKEQQYVKLSVKVFENLMLLQFALIKKILSLHHAEFAGKHLLNLLRKT